MVGQLGHGDTAAYKAPHKVETFEDTPIHHVSCGEDFTVSVTGKFHSKDTCCCVHCHPSFILSTPL